MAHITPDEKVWAAFKKKVSRSNAADSPTQKIEQWMRSYLDGSMPQEDEEFRQQIEEAKELMKEAEDLREEADQLEEEAEDIKALVESQLQERQQQMEQRKQERQTGIQTVIQDGGHR